VLLLLRLYFPIYHALEVIFIYIKNEMKLQDCFSSKYASTIFKMAAITLFHGRPRRSLLTPLKFADDPAFLPL